MADNIFEVRLEGLDRVLARAPFNEAALRRAEEQAMRRTAFWLRGKLQENIPVRTGQTRGRMTDRVITQGDEVLGLVGGKSISAGGFNILRGLEEGTGIHGPRKQRIYPTRAKVLRWIDGAKPVAGTGGSVHFARSVAGMVARRPFRRTKEEQGDAARELYARVFSEFYNAGR